MFNKKVIVISGFSRGGTNILWNILQSHPSICSVGYETGTMFRKRRHKFSRVIQALIKTGLIKNSLSKRILDLQFYRYKMNKNFHHSENKFKSESELYSKAEVKKAAVCFKSVDEDINYTDILFDIYPDLYFIGLARNGYAVLEGHLRRGEDVETFARKYSRITTKMRHYAEKDGRFKLVKFENILSDPFVVAEELYEFLDLHPRSINKLRIKSKKIMKDRGKHESNFGKSGKKYWFNRENIHEILDPGINNNQIERLTKKQMHTFNQHAKNALSFFNYQILE